MPMQQAPHIDADADRDPDRNLDLAPDDTAALEAALRALHIASIHLEQAAAGPKGRVLVARTGHLVRKATTLLAAAARLGGTSGVPDRDDRPL
jgi:hypothetical protein